MSILERISALHEKGLLSSNDVRQLTNADHQLNIDVADKMIENVLLGPILDRFAPPASK